MNIEIITPKPFTGYDSWTAKQHGVIFVKQESDIEPVWEALCRQDDYWESYKKLIKVAPPYITNVSDLDRYCEYCGKTDIYDVAKLKEKLLEYEIEILIYQTYEY